MNAMRRMLSPAVTLTEVLLVVVIFAVVAGLAFQNAGRAMEKAKVQSAWPMLRLIDAAAKAFNRDNGSWPDLPQLTTNNYLDDPNEGQSDWTYQIDPTGNPKRWAQAMRQGGPCNGKRLRRFFRSSGGISDGAEIDDMPACP